MYNWIERVRTINNLDELEELVQPIFDWINKNGNAYTQVVIDLEGVRVTEDIAGLPIKRD